MIEEEKIEDLLSEILVIKDLYICGRMNKSVYDSSTNDKNTKAWTRYYELALSYINDSVIELYSRFNTISLLNNAEVLNIIFDTCYMDFDEDLVNEMMLDFYGSRDSIPFATAYNYFGEDFNNLLLEAK